MAKPTGFLEFTRETPEDRPLLERIKDWQPVHLHLPDGRLQNQAARCMDCGIPFCHTGKVINGMASGCPINNLIPEWNDLVYQGLWQEAYDRLSKTNNFPEFTGLVCPAPCEAACTLGINDPPVTIKNIEYAIIEKAYEEGWVTPTIPAKRTGKKVAVIGSGPAGLACADQLNCVGHEVTVFERADRLGGLLMYGIPNMKLDKNLVQRRLDLMSASGIIFRPNTHIGVDVPAEQLRDEFDAIVICTGATRPRDLAVDGRSLNGIHFAMDFLHGNTKTLLEMGDGKLETPQSPISHLPSPISAAGKDVIVIGGGDTGTDCVATALRHGCKSLVQFEIMPQPPAQRAPDNPWPQWPKVYKLDYGQEEAAAVFGADPRQYAILTKRLTGDEQGNLQAVETVEIEWVVGSNGRPQLQEISGTHKKWPSQLVLIAMGFLGPENPVLAQLGVAQDARSNAQAQYGSFMTNVEGVFAAGDARRGQSLVVWAINEGRSAARAIDQWLMGETDLP
ncbi:MAG: glutamate synthase subunit beta [Chloroflexi bacterium]|nr:glutamate synthase subunit beta [Chloroflexota bacterium]